MKIKPQIQPLLSLLSGILIEMLVAYTNIFQTFYITFFIAGVVYLIAGTQLQKYQFTKTNTLFFLLPLIAFKIFFVKVNSYNFPFIFPFCFIVSIFSFAGGYLLNVFTKSFLLFLSLNACLIYFLGFVKSPQLVFERQEKNENRYNGIQLKNWNLLKIDGSNFSFEEVKGKIILLNFSWKNCRQCIQKQPYLEQIGHKYKDNSRFVLVEVYLGDYDTIETAQSFSRKNAVKLQWAYDSKNELAKKLNYSGAPYEVLIDAKGAVRKINAGFDENIAILYLEKTFEKIDFLLNKPTL